MRTTVEGPCAAQVLDPPLVLSSITATTYALKAERADDTSAPPEKTLLRCLKALIQAGIDDLIDDRPDEARRLVAAIGAKVAKEALAAPETTKSIRKAVRRGSTACAAMMPNAPPPTDDASAPDAGDAAAAATSIDIRKAVRRGSVAVGAIMPNAPPIEDPATAVHY